MMATENATDPVDGFFARCGLPPAHARAVCVDAVHALFLGPGGSVHEAAPQGYCSYTLVCRPGHDDGRGYDRDGVDDDEEEDEEGGKTIFVQFRPPRHGIDVGIARQAREIYGDLVPDDTALIGVICSTKGVHLDRQGEAGFRDDNPDLIVRIETSSSLLKGDIGPNDNGLTPVLEIYSMKRLPGISLADHCRMNRPEGTSRSAASSAAPGIEIEPLIRDFARFIAAGWEDAQRRGGLRARSRGRVGASLRWRLELMRDGLPARFAPFVRRVLDGLDRIESLPWVLTHGDLVPANIMVEVVDNVDNNRDGITTATTTSQRFLRLRGLLDWAEAEHLPFGVGLYGIEELLLLPDLPAEEEEEEHTTTTPTYHPASPRLRTAFWAELHDRIPELRADETLRDAVGLARELGVLLWHGIAFDDGRLDRAVRPGPDDGEIARLDLFLSLDGDDREVPRGNDRLEDVDLRAVKEDEEMMCNSSSTTRTTAETDLLTGYPARESSLAEAMKGAWGLLTRLRFPGPIFGKI